MCPCTTVIGVDPGHVNLIDAAKKISNPSSVACKKHGLSQYTLKNTRWRAMNGNQQLVQRIQSQNKRHGMARAACKLADCSSRNLLEYDLHISARIETSSVFKPIMELKNRRRWKFYSYQKEQRAVQKLATEVLDGIDD